VWVNIVSRHFIGARFGGYKQSGIGRKEWMDELLGYSKIKNNIITLEPRASMSQCRKVSVPNDALHPSGSACGNCLAFLTGMDCLQ
jgi:hypothetical protein